MDETTQFTREMMEALGAPFPEDEIDFLPKAQSGGQALGLAYIDARDVMRRLDLVVGPANWSFDFDVLAANGKMVKGRLTVLGVTKCDAGEADQEDEPLKSAVSDALKRCAVHFGIGRYLYYLPRIWAPFDAQKRRFAERPRLDPQAVARALRVCGVQTPRPAGALRSAEGRELRAESPATAQHAASPQPVITPGASGPQPANGHPVTSPQPTAHSRPEGARPSAAPEASSPQPSAAQGTPGPQPPRENGQAPEGEASPRVRETPTAPGRKSIWATGSGPAGAAPRTMGEGQPESTGDRAAARLGSRPGAPPTPPRAEGEAGGSRPAGGEAPPALQCSGGDCGKALTKGQHDVSVRAYGQPLCPACQKQHARAGA